METTYDPYTKFEFRISIFKATMSVNSSEEVTSPGMRSESRGSSVSTGLREEYEDLLRYAVVTPVIDGKLPPTSRPKSPPFGATRRGVVQAEVSKVQSESEESDSTLGPETPQQHPDPQPQSHKYTSTTLSKQLDDITRGSHDSVEPPTMDPEMTRLETQLDAWCLDLKRNVLAEFGQSRIRLSERHQVELHRERQQHAHDLREVQEELERYKELTVTYEQTIARKDHIIASLTKAMQKQKERVELQRGFSLWKLRHMDDKRESFTTALARKHYHQKLQFRVWTAWFGIVQGRWKNRVEKACQSKAEEVCVQLTNEYEERLAAVHHSLDESRQEVANLRAERELYEENMKKAFMRGVCALNMEAMTMFRPPEGGESHGHHSDGELQSSAYNHAHEEDGCHAGVTGHPPITIERPTEQVEIQSNGFHALQKSIHLTATSTDPNPRVPTQTRAQKPRNGQKQVVGTARQTRKAAPVRGGPSVVVQRHMVVNK